MPCCARRRSSEIDVRVQHVRGRKRLERRVAAVPARAEAVGDAIEVLRHRRVLQVRREQPEAALEARAAGPRGARLREQRRARCRSAPRTPSAGTSTACRPPSTRAGRRPCCRRCPRPTSAPARRGPAACPAPIGDAERREETGGMKPAPVELPGRHRPDAARDLVGDRDGQDQVAAGHAAASRRAPAPRPPTGCSCGRSTRCACRRTRAPARTRRWRTRPRQPPCGRRCPTRGWARRATSPAPRRASSGRTACRARPATGRCTSSIRSFVVVDDVRRQIVEGEPRRPTPPPRWPARARA